MAIEVPTTEKQTSPKKAKKQKTRQDTITAEQVLVTEEAYRRGLVSIRDLIAPSSLQVSPMYLQLGNRYLRTIFVTTFPRYISVGWFAPIINFNASLDVAMFFYPVEAKIVLKQLQNQVGNIEAQLSEEHEKGMPRDPVKETALKDIERLRDELTTGVEHFFQFSLYVTIYAKDEKELDTLTEKIENLFASKLVYTRRAFYQAEQGFDSTLPLANDKIMVSININSSPIASSFPFISADLTSDNGILYGINRHNNSLILFDRFSMPNANFTIFASSGSGKSLTKDTPVLVKDKGNIQLIEIGPLVEKIIKKRGAVQIEDEIEGVVDPGLEVYTFNKELKGEWSNVTIAARKKAPKTLYQFKTQSGRSITTTGDHNMLVLREGKVVADKSDNIKEGEYVPLSREISGPKNPTKDFNLLTLLKNAYNVYVDGAQEFIQQHYSVLKNAKINPKFDRYLYKYRQRRRIPLSYFMQILQYLSIEPDKELCQKVKVCSRNNKGKENTYLPALFEITPEFLRILGYIISEGTTGDKYVLITNTNPEVQDDIKLCLKKLNIAYNIRAGETFAFIGRAFVELIKAIGAYGKSGEKRVPPFIFNLSNEHIAEFLKAYFEGDGGVESASINATSKSADLISDLSYLLMRHGIVSRSGVKKKCATNTLDKKMRSYWHISITGQSNLKQFLNNINFVSVLKKEKLRALIGKNENTNVDLVPGVQNIFREVYELFSFQLHGLSDISNIKNGFYNPSRDKLKELIKKIEQRIEQFKELEKKFEILETLPQLSSIIDTGKNNKEINTELWSSLGHSWRLMKNKEIRPRSVNVFKAVKIINGALYSLTDIKQAVHTGFKRMNLSIKHYKHSLNTSLVHKPESNMRYDILYEAATFVQDNYQRMLERIPQVEEKLQHLKLLAHSDLFWDPIVEIKKLQNKGKYVYDLMVDNEVFLAGQNGMFVHNSFFAKLEVLRSMMMGTDVIIIDPEKEYKHLSDAVGGTYVNISLSADAKLNPFDLPRAQSKDVKTTDLIRSAVITVKGLLKIAIGAHIGEGVKGFTPQEDSLLDRALLETYAKKDIIPGADLSRAEMPTMSDLQQVLEGMEGGADLAQRLKKYTEGTFSGFLNHPTNVKMDNQLVAFSVRDLEDELRPLAIYTIVNYVWNTVRSELKKRILLIDEAWWLMQNEDSAKFIFALVKRCRKYYLGVTTITQDVADFLNSPYGRGVVTNSAMQLLLKQSTAAIEQVSKTFMLTEGEKYLLLECGVGEGIFFAGQKHAAIKIVASYSEDQLITSDPQQLLEIERSKQEFAESQEE
ncbi:hypothetical protein MYX07_00525 [Patescibacteria group bacterium AH-259-L07]|nr:hypothetical protein [Patescibacteria group bacterium AH-259-L07]